MIEKNYVSYIQWMCKYHVAFYSIILGGGGGDGYSGLLFISFSAV